MTVDVHVSTPTELLAQGNGLSAIDASMSTCDRGFGRSGLPRRSRRAGRPRELIVCDEAIRQRTSVARQLDGTFGGFLAR